jgi:hypothetical protein
MRRPTRAIEFFVAVALLSVCIAASAADARQDTAGACIPASERAGGSAEGEGCARGRARSIRQDLAADDCRRRLAIGPPVIVPDGPPMELTATGTETRRALVLILHDSTQPHTTVATDWKPKGLCTNK